MESKIRVAHIMGKMLGGGVESFVMNYYRNIDKSKIQFDFIVDEDSKYIPKDEIERLGGRVIIVPPYQHILRYIKKLKEVFRDNNYKIVHSHINSLSVFPLYCAKREKIPIRIAHSHSTTNKKEWKKNIIKCILRPFSRVFANYYFACSKHAGEWLFGKKFFESGKVEIIRNAIDTNKFCYKTEIRNKIRNELNLQDKFVVGHVGRFISQKNHERVLTIFNEILKKNNSAILLLIGNGPLESSIKEKVKVLGIEQNVIFLGIREDVNELFQAMDVFLFPSLYEGLGMVLIEAQALGLYCITSTNVPKEANVTNNIEYISLKEDDKYWAKRVIENGKKIVSKEICRANIMKNGYDISVECKKIEDIYLKLGS